MRHGFREEVALHILSEVPNGVSQLHEPESRTGIPDGDYFVKVPDAAYVTEFIGAQSFWYRGRYPRLAMWFLIVEGEFSGAKLAAYCNLKSLECRRGRRSRDPEFSVGWRSDLTLQLATLFPDRYSPDELPTTIPEQDMHGHQIRVETRTVTTSHSGKKRPTAFHCSVVESVNGWALP